ncbi:MAG: hypothetical protein LBC20_17215 [Planctomycetaceae bacterium]|jgi:hypothetical protein|nr:hypothetical protein [Planctomycetaceae bacterium]
MTKNILTIYFMLVICNTFLIAEEVCQVLDDRNYSQGFTILGTKHDQPKRIETFGQEGVTPRWQIAQWHSKGTLDCLDLDENTIKFSDPYKSVLLNRQTGAINLTVLASKEWNNVPRESHSEPWPHLLLSQSPFTNPINIAHAQEIRVTFDFELTLLQKYGEQKNNLHTAQVGWFLYLKNTNKQSKGFHDFLWFGISLFDSRRDFTSTYAAQDFAMPNGKFIYTIGNKTYLTKKVEVGQRQKIQYDILPEVQKALDTAHQKGFIVHSNIQDMVFDGMNIGWEIPGVYDAGMTFYQLSVEVIKKSKIPLVSNENKH